MKVQTARCVALRAGGFEFVLAALILLCWSSGAHSESLISKGSAWTYRDIGLQHGWQAPDFDGASWAEGPAELGFGDHKESTVLTATAPAGFPTAAVYFRKRFWVDDPAAFAALHLLLKRDDGAAVYLNGFEVVRSNMPAGPILYFTFASTAVGGDQELRFVSHDISSEALVAGENVLAVEVHQRSLSSSDISFDLALLGLAHPDDPVVVQGPYLQRVSADSIVVRWSSHRESIGRVYFGRDPHTLDRHRDGSLAFDHEVALEGLDADTLYHYAVASPGQSLESLQLSGSFRTAPRHGESAPVRFWVLGDSGEANRSARTVRDDFLAFTGERIPDGMWMLGDNAYPTGTRLQYQAAVFDTYPDELRNTVLWPTFGNHDAISANSSLESGPYYDLFTLPRHAESGGLPSGTEAYYSFDYANVHVIVLDSQGSNRRPGGALMTWAAAVLAATGQEWFIAWFHHPPYTTGSHASAAPVDSGGRMVHMRTYALPILEAGGVDLVLTGHSHVYERSMLIDGHYGFSPTFTDIHVVDDGDGCLCESDCSPCPNGGQGPYVKESVGGVAHEGTVYSTVGSSSKATGSLGLDHPVMILSLRETGSMVLDIDGLRMDALWIREGGEIIDSFTLLKGGDSDGDLLPDPEDNCPEQANPDQEDYDGDGLGDLCDEDRDADGVGNELDQCPHSELGAVVGSKGCSASELIELQCYETPRSGRFRLLRCVVRTTIRAAIQDLIPRREFGKFLVREIHRALRHARPRHSKASRWRH
jgi:hypothetical protein